MLFPMICGENLSDMFRDAFEPLESSKHDPLFGRHAARVMRTDIREKDEGYEIDVDLPGFKKEDVKVELKDGYLTISAQKSLERSSGEKEHGHYLRRERYQGACSRSFYVGEAITETDVKAKFENGVLAISVPKKVAPPAKTNAIMIE